MPSRVLPRSGFVVLALLGIATGAFYYALARAMAETVHFNLRASVAGLLIGGLFPLMFYGLAIAMPQAAARGAAWLAGFWVLGVVILATVFARAGLMSLYGLGFAGLLIAPVAHRVSGRSVRFSLGVLAGALLIGAVIAEIRLLVDDARFVAEVARLKPDQGYTRERAWPATDCALIYSPGRGIHATD